MPGGHRGSGRRAPHPDDQAAGLRTLFDMAEPNWNDRERDYESRRAGWHRDRSRGGRRHYRDVRTRRSAVLAQREVAQGTVTDEVTPGALRNSYDIPTIKFDRKEARGLFLTSIVVAGWVSYHLGWQSLALLACAAPGAAFRAVNYVLSWFDKPVTATAEGYEKLDRLQVTRSPFGLQRRPGTARPLYLRDHEPDQTAERSGWSTTGPRPTIRGVASYWTGTWSNGTEIHWTRQSNQAKRRTRLRLRARARGRHLRHRRLGHHP